MAVEERIKSIIAEQLGVKPEEVTPEASFIDDLGADSLDTVELIMALDVCEYIIRAAMERRESRGAHYRLDHPEEDLEWRKTIILSKRDEAIQIDHAAIGEAFE